MRIFYCIITLIISFGLSELNADTGEIVTIGFIEGGENTTHAAFRRQLRDQLSVPGLTDKRIIFVPEGFKSAKWDREKCKKMAAELADDKTIDLVFALGPWTVEDLLEAGFDRPIVAAIRFDPLAEKIIDRTGRPVANNLTVRYRPKKIASDIGYLFSLLPIKKLGFLHFPSGEDKDSLMAQVREVASRYGAEVETASGYDRNGAFAFFKAYQQLGKDIDALYLTPLWGFTPEKTRQFYNMTIRDKIPTFSAEGEYDVARGAMASGSVETARERAKYYVWKVIQIINGSVPADLPTIMPDISGLTVNDFVATASNIKRDGRYFHQAVLIESPPSGNIEYLSLQVAIGIGLTQNPDYLSKFELLEAAKEAVSEVSSSYLPQVNTVLSASRISSSPETFSHMDVNQYFAGINLDQTILSLTTIRDINLASEQKNSVSVEYKKAALDLELGITLACIEHIRARQLRDVEISTLKDVRQSVNVARISAKIGEGGEADQLRLEAEWLKANRRVFNASARRDISHQLLNIILGRPGTLEFYLKDAEFSRNKLTSEVYQIQTLLTSRDRVVTAVNHLATLAEDSNPELEAVSIDLALINLKLSRNRVDWLPKVGFQATFGHNLLNYPTVQKNFRDDKDEFNTWAVGAQLQWSLFQGGKRLKAKSRLTSELRSIENQADFVHLQLSGRIETSLIRIKTLADNYSLAIRSAELSSEYLTTALDQYNMGIMSLVGLLDAIDNDRETAIELINIYFDYFAESSLLIRELGLSSYDNNSTAGHELITMLSALYN